MKMFGDTQNEFMSIDAELGKHSEKKTPIVSIRPVTSSSTTTGSSSSDLTSTPLDSGRAAYSVLLSCFLIQAVTSGFPLAYGVFEDYYSTKFEEFEIASWIGVLNEGLPYLGAPLMTICCERFRIPRQAYIIAGISLCVTSHIASAFMTRISGLITTQGCLFGIGSLLTEIPSLVILDTHFEKRRGLAYGIVLGGADLAGVGYAFLAIHLLGRYTYRVAMFVFASLTFVIGAMGIWFLRERTASTAESIGVPTFDRRDSFVPGPLMRARPLVPPAHLHSYNYDFRSTEQESQEKFYKQGIFYILNAANIILAIGESLPWIYLPTFSTELGYSKNSGALILAGGMLSMFIGEIGFGSLSDKFDVKLLIIGTMSVSSLATFLLWGVLGSTNLGTLIAYACIFSGSSGGFLALWARMGMLFGEDDSTMVYSILSMGKGAGGILSGPISQVLLRKSSSTRLGGKHSARWGTMIAYVGSCTSVSALMGIVAIIASVSRRTKS